MQKKWHYIYYGGSLQGSSVQDKIICQIRGLNANGLPVEGNLFSTKVKEITPINENTVLIPLPLYTKNRKYFRNYYESQFHWRFIENYIRENYSDQPIFLRHGANGRGYIHLLEKFRDNLFLYIPSHTILETFREKQYAPKTSIVGMAFRWIEFFFCFYIWEWYLWKWGLAKLKGVVVFTPEFKEILLKYSIKKPKIFYNADGVDCKKVQMRKYQRTEGVFSMVFMKGSSTAQPWSGLNRLIQSIASQPNEQVILYITGNAVNQEFQKYPFVKSTGRLSYQELEDLINKVDLGVGNLANYLIGFHQTTNLKSRDYFARALPFVHSCEMPDVPNGYFHLQVPNDNSLIPIKELKEFAEKSNIQLNEMRAFAEKNLDWEIKTKELKEILIND